MGTATFIDILLAILLPPLGVFLRYGCGVEFWICLVLTLLGNNRFVVFSSLSVTDSSFLSSEFYRCCVLHCYYTISLNPSFV
ncbi:hypothetical protein IGI04_020954 [Brassica rapa subsp. trilocularis]|uniref:Uncharacterized protein n=1 Tax=Brassica rapa subsp. trilocularis TaxID=1813537 RepID=A0ABQ7MKZ0_BRACM|nr:hypothetical protein IGI04_020954 [Brassica rapa subsp. trilocularis]